MQDGFQNISRLLIVAVLLIFSSQVWALDEVINTDTKQRLKVLGPGDILTIDGARFIGNIRVHGGTLKMINEA